ncbi:hypothetical protein RvY_06986 [Ramazzottius varieornatus]|uniref:Enoyl reductase (ER) domain-containing protein n=1 Tax=Ramazzottius varieornatus TaxID=947166 RepID=A0A1D1V0F7_RAMVA|nr:hypothetical protein RvY_06986 [Ramazzottius varieornatus]
MQNLLTNLSDKLAGKEPVSTGRTKPLTSETEKMMAIVFNGSAGNIKYQATPKVMISEPHDALIRMTATSVCGLDTSAFAGYHPGFKTGDILGHELVGVVEQTGPNVRIPVGTRVAVAAIYACGQCRMCQADKYQACETTNSSALLKEIYGQKGAALPGYGHLTGEYPGTLAEFVRVPFADVNCLPLPDSVSDEKAIYLSDNVPIAYHACRRVKQGDVVGIWGLGPVGFLTARWCRILGASRVIAISGTTDRLDIARDSLGIEVIDYHQEKDVVAKLAEMVPDGLDVAIDCTGARYAKSLSHKVQQALYIESDTPETLTECSKSLKYCGNVTIVGTYGGTANGFPIGQFYIKHLSMDAGFAPVQKLWQDCLKAMVDGTLDPSFCTTHHMRLSQASRAMEMMEKSEDNFIKCILRPDYRDESEQPYSKI